MSRAKTERAPATHGRSESASGSAGSMASAGNSNGPALRLVAHAAKAGDAQLVARLLGEGRDVKRSGPQT